MEDIEKIEQEMREVAENGIGCFYVLILGVVFLLAVLAVIAIIVC